MAQILRADTEVVVHIGPFVDVTDGFTPQTDITLGGNEAELMKHDATTTVDISAAAWTAITAVRGWYRLTLTTSHTDTEGPLTVIVQDDSDTLPVYARFQVITADAYDYLYASTAAPDTQAAAVQTDLDTLTAGVSVTSMAANVVTAAAIADAAIDNATFAADVGTTAFATNNIALAANKSILDFDPPTRAELTTDINSVLNILQGLVL